MFEREIDIEVPTIYARCLFVILLENFIFEGIKMEQELFLIIQFMIVVNVNLLWLDLKSADILIHSLEDKVA